MPPEVLLLFFATSLVLALAPGPDNIFVLTQSLAYGSRAGVLIVFGLCTGLLMHTALVGLGIAAMLAASPHALLVVKALGAGYLLFLAYQSWHAGLPVATAQAAQPMGAWRLYRRGIFMNATNPKVMLFFIAFLPQFVDPDQGRVTAQILLLGGLFLLATLAVFGGIALLAGRYSERINRAAHNRRRLHRAVSVILALLALNLFVGVL